MEDNKSLAKALVEFQKEVPTIDKRQTAKIVTKTGSNYSYKYADLADIWAAIREPLGKHGLAVTQHLEGGSDGHTAIRTIIWHESGEKHETAVDIPTQGKTAQEAGSLFTYYKRYALGAALGISTEEDDDASSSNTPPEAPKVASSTKPASDKQKDLIRKLARDQGLADELIDARLAEINTSAEASDAIKRLQQ